MTLVASGLRNNFDMQCGTLICTKAIILPYLLVHMLQLLKNANVTEHFRESKHNYKLINVRVKVNVKIKVTLEQATKAQRKS